MNSVHLAKPTLREFTEWLITRWDRFGAMVLSVVIFLWLIGVVWMALSHYESLTHRIQANDAKQLEDHQKIIKLEGKILDQIK